MVATVGRDDVGRAQNDVVCAIGTIARGVRGAKESDGGSAKRDRKMKRARVAADDARCIAQESHERTKRTIVRQGIGVTAAFTNGQGKVVFSRAEVHNTTQAQGVSNQLAKLSETFGRPAF